MSTSTVPSGPPVPPAQTVSPGRAVPPGQIVLVGKRVGWRVSARTTIVSIALFLAILIIGTLTLFLGSAGISPAEVIGSFTGEVTGLTRTVVTDWRLSRVVSALVFGAALGASGAIFQSLTRNPLGSPDIIGFNTGAYTGALLVMLVIGTSSGFLGVSLGALVGGVVTASAVYLLARRGGAAGLRLIIVGLGVSAMLAAANRWMILTADLTSSMSAAVWGAGSLNGLRWNQVLVPVLILAVLLVLAVGVNRHIDVLDLGDEMAAGLGERVSRWRFALLILGVALTAGVTAVAGPIAFVALAAPQLAVRITRSASLAIIPSAAMGAILLGASDLIAQRAFAPIPMPVGVVTVTIGGCYLIYLIARESRT